MKNVLSTRDIEFYQHNGYLLLKNFFSSDKIQLALSAIQEIIDCKNIAEIAELEPKDPSVIRRIWSPTKRHIYFKEMASDPKLLDVIQEMIGPNIAFHYSKLNMKGKNVGSVVEWHQDFAYYPHTNSDLLACLIYLDDATTENGCLQVIPGSHQWGVMDHYIGNYFRGKINSDLLATQKNKITFLEAPAGSVIFLHCLTIHSSAINQSKMPRRTFLPAYRAADSYPIYYGSHASHNEPDAFILRGKPSRIARIEAGQHLLPLAEKEFHSLYEVQEGAHIYNHNQIKSSTGYFANIQKSFEKRTG